MASICRGVNRVCTEQWPFHRTIRAFLRASGHDHLVERHAERVRRVAAEMLVGEEEDLLAALPRPLEGGRGVRRGAHHAAALAAERLDGRSGVDVGDRDDRAQTHLLEIVPGELEVLGIGHIRHRTAGRQVRENDLLMVAAQHVGAFRHEMDAAEHDELGVRVAAHLPRELEGVAGVVGEPDHLVALVVMAEDHQPAAEPLFGGGEAGVHLLVGQPEIPLGERLALTEVFLFVLRQDRQQHGRRRACALVKLFSIQGREKAKLQKPTS
jgi:hypothetical protein